ncbi:ATP-binding cassette domain-containing protein [Humibacter ginsenosidimutans]|uniref:ATP-binding cassette domain-containing protein n=1 Tax=Humibacter ginsenosidimutans TaxID=2599293 RepID=A0A5B8MA22_9MICO|nr:ATP-binding cassette domain-containing protein [Humibacter ginsenosidimutans]QDZ16542.1 ATP-binding cassette domain-containing protein [Humibacter ginsenosidimutans]
MTTTHRQPVIEVTGLRKAYGKHAVLDGVDLHVGRGEIYALLGPNGAGKTTTVNILSTLVRPDAGSARIGGVDVLARPAQAKRMFALTGQYASVDEFQTGTENLAMMATLNHVPRAERRGRVRHLLEAFDLMDAANKRVGGYSGGMRRRLDLAISLVATPPVLFLDEPTTGLDPRSRAQLWSLVDELANAGTTILLTTQYLDEAERLADRVGVIDGGVIVATGTPDELKSQVSGDHIVFTFETRDDAQRAAASAGGKAGVEVVDDDTAVRMPTVDAVADIRGFLAHTASAGIQVTDIAIVGPTLDDVFLTLTGRPATTGADGDTKQNDSTQKEKAA